MDALQVPVAPGAILDVRGPMDGSSRLLLASPHSGSQYEPSFLAASALGPDAIRRSEDSFVDELFGVGPEIGVPMLAARFPRAFCDVNRERWELDPGMFAERLPEYCNTTSPRVRAGFGTIARVVANGEPIYARKLTFAEARSRIERLWDPYHATLRMLIHTILRRTGSCVLLDCHSMPSEPSRQRSRPDFILGDQHGTSCSPELVDLVEAQLGSAGHSVRRNQPYAGGYVTRHYGQPRVGVHVLQIEVARHLYMDETRLERSAGFAALRTMLGGMLAVVSGWSATLDALDGPGADPGSADDAIKKMAVPKHRQV